MALYNLSNEYDLQNFKEKCNEMVRKKAYVELKNKLTTRSLAQNSYCHVLLGFFGSEFGLTIEQVKYDYFKKKCNKDIFERTRTNKRGKQVTYIRSTTELDKGEMTTAIERFRNWSSSECGLYLPSPHESEMLFYAQQQIESNKEFL